MTATEKNEPNVCAVGSTSGCVTEAIVGGVVEVGKLGPGGGSGQGGVVDGVWRLCHSRQPRPSLFDLLLPSPNLHRRRRRRGPRRVVPPPRR